MYNQNNIYKEYSLLNSYMFNYGITCGEKLPKLNINIFTTPFTRDIALIINMLVDKHEYCDDLAVEAFAIRKNSWNNGMWIELVSTVPLCESSIEFYSKWLTYNMAQRKLGDINGN